MSKYDELNAKVAVLEKQGNELKERMNNLSEFTYNYVDANMPDWARPIIAALVHVGIINGINSEGELGLHLSELRAIVWDYRSGVYDKKLKVSRNENGDITASPIVDMFREEMIKRYGK